MPCSRRSPRLIKRSCKVWCSMMLTRQFPIRTMATRNMGQPRKRLGSAASSTVLALVACACAGAALAQTGNPADAGGAGTPGAAGPATNVGPGSEGFLGTPVGRSQSANFGITQGFGETDNVFLTPGDKQSQTLSSTDVTFGYV